MSDELEKLLQGIPQADHEEIVKKVQARIENAALDELKAYHAEKDQAKAKTLEAEYRAEMLAHRGKPREITAIRQKYQAMGLDTGKVSF